MEDYSFPLIWLFKKITQKKTIDVKSQNLGHDAKYLCLLMPPGEARWNKTWSQRVFCVNLMLIVSL